MTEIRAIRSEKGFFDVYCGADYIGNHHLGSGTNRLVRFVKASGLFPPHTALWPCKAEGDALGARIE